MPLLKTVSEEEATGTIKEMYTMMKGMAGFVPKPMQMYSVSPGMFEMQKKSIEYFMGHPNLSPILLAAIRYVGARTSEFPYCLDLNGDILMKMAGLSEEQLKALADDPGSITLPDRDKAMLAFVHKALTAPEDVAAEDVQKLRDMGWTDLDIFDASSHGAHMVAGGILFNTFKMGI